MTTATLAELAALRWVRVEFAGFHIPYRKCENGVLKSGRVLQYLYKTDGSIGKLNNCAQSLRS
jgi:hypothetical protein